MKYLFIVFLPLMFACQQDALMVTISGRCYFAGDNMQGVQNTVVEAIGQQSYQTAVNPDGTYSIYVHPGDYIVRPYKRTDTLNGIDLNDRSIIQQHLIGAVPLSQWAKFASDVNNNGIMTSFDAYLVGAAVLNVPDGRSIVGGWWTFCPDDYEADVNAGFFVPAYPTTKTVNAVTDVMGIDFIGFRRGDPNMSADPKK